MRKLFLALTMSITYSLGGTITVVGACACNAKIGEVFTNIDTHIVDDNLDTIPDAIKKASDAYDKKIAKLKDESAILDELIVSEKAELVYLKKLVFLTDSENLLRTKHKNIEALKGFVNNYLKTKKINKGK